MNDTQLLRYARHIQLPEMDIEGQDRLLESHALIIGAGGLGSPAAMYLAASGVGRLTIVDDDTVALSNLQRQILFGTDDVGRSKVDAARDALQRLNPDVVVQTVAQRADDVLLEQYVNKADIVLDCSDNFATRHAVNRACVHFKKTLVSGAAIRFDGQISVFDTQRDDSPCYACLFPPEQSFPDEPCSTLGVFAPLVGIIGAMQAAEALKVLANIGQPLIGQLLTLDARLMQWHALHLTKNPHCSVCAK